MNEKAIKQLNLKMAEGRKLRDEWTEKARADMNNRQARQNAEWYSGYVEGIQTAQALVAYYSGGNNE